MKASLASQLENSHSEQLQDIDDTLEGGLGLEGGEEKKE
jgi:hypothetical protein